jgi:YHS domain-containing protein
MNLFKVFLIAIALVASALGWAAGSGNVEKNGLALQGYDPVSYFVDNRPMKGKPEFEAKGADGTYYFATAQNRDAFITKPAQYEPQYGGFCAFGVAKGFKPEIDPNSFKVVDGKLYLNKNPDIASRWNADVAGHISAADSNWKSLATK